MLVPNYCVCFRKLLACGVRGPGFDSRPRHSNLQRWVISRFQVAIWLKYRWSGVNPQYNQTTCVFGSPVALTDTIQRVGLVIGRTRVRVPLKPWAGVHVPLMERRLKMLSDTRARVGVSSARKRTIVANGQGVRQPFKILSLDDFMYKCTCMYSRYITKISLNSQNVT